MTDSSDRVYIAPAGTEPPTATAVDSTPWAEAAAFEPWHFDARAAEVARATALSYAEAGKALAEAEGKTFNLELKHTTPEPYRPNRAARRAAARATRRATT